MTRFAFSTPTRRMTLAGLAAAALAPGAMAADYPPTAGEMQEFVLLEKRAPAPDVPFLDGKERDTRLSNYFGDVLLVNFWATWCAPCIEEMPSLARLADAFEGQPFRLMAISQDRGGRGVAEPFIRERLGLPNLQIFYDPKLQLGRAFGARGLPSTYLIDRKGRLIGGLEGAAEWDGPDAKALIRHVLKEGGGTSNAVQET